MLRFLNNMASDTVQKTFKELVDKGYLKVING
jgi:DNA-binding transcriptional regulator YhcF (GntR family)